MTDYIGSINDLIKTLPLNTKNIFLRGVTPCGCKIFIPTNEEDENKQQSEKNLFQERLDELPGIPRDIA